MRVEIFRKSIVIMTSVFMFIFLVSGCFLLPQEEDILQFDLLQPAEVEFTTIQVERGSITNILRDYSTATSATLHEMSFQNRSGYLAEVNVQSGDVVKEGDILAKLETGTLENDLQRHKLSMERLELNLTQARRSGDRIAIRNAEIDLEIATITLNQLEEELEKTTIIAPFDGEIVFLNNLRIGQFIPSRHHMMTVADNTLIRFVYTGQHSMSIRYGMEAEIIIDANTNIPVTVTMTPHEVPIEELDRYRETIVFTPVNPGSIPPEVSLGRRYDFIITLQEKDDVIVVPRSAVSSFMGQFYVQILEDGMRVERDIVVGITTNREIEVISGLEENEVLITGTRR